MTFNRNTRMTKEWNGIPGGTAIFTTNATAILGSLASLVANTVLRAIGEYVIAPTVAPAAADHCIVTVALGVVSTDAAALGATAMPDPFDEPEYPWLYWANHDLFFGDASMESGSAAASVRREFDVHSMRKLKPGQSCALVAQYVDVAGAPPVTLSMGQVRTLFAT